jgi:lysophospholipase L1-like esterase
MLRIARWVATLALVATGAAPTAAQPGTGQIDGWRSEASPPPRVERPAQPAGNQSPPAQPKTEAPSSNPVVVSPSEMDPALSAALAPASVGKPRLDWRVKNPFRFFNDARDTELHRATLAALPPEQQRKSPVLASERALAARHPEGWAAMLRGSPCWSDKTHSYVCPDASPYVFPRTHRIVASLADLPDAATVNCTWLTSPHVRPARRGTAIAGPCNKPVELDIPYPDGARLTVEIGGREITRTEVRVTDLLIAGLGDSFASGEGNPDLPVRFSRERAADYGSADKRNPESGLVGYPARVGSWRQLGDKAFMAGNARWLDQACHRSLYSHQMRAALQLALEDPHRAVTFVGLACSGADVATGLFLRYTGNEWVPNPPAYSQISALAEAQCGANEAPAQDLPEAYHMSGRIPELQGGLVLRKCDREHARQIDLLLVSIGGNDVGFARLVANAVLSDKSNLKMLGGWFGHVHGASEAEAALRVLDDRYKSFNRALHNILHLSWEENDRVLLTAYPAMALLDDGQSVCPDSSAGMEVAPVLRLSAAKAREGQRVAEKLNRVMRTSAREHGWTFVESHRNKFLGRGICSGWAENALSSVDDLRLPRRLPDGRWEPYNPADFKAYASRQRWFRTPNDAFMTGNFHVTQSLIQRVLKLQSVAWFQLLLAATYSGAFHPTAEGQAAIADAVVDRARHVLDRYARRDSTLR